MRFSTNEVGILEVGSLGFWLILDKLKKSKIRLIFKIFELKKYL
jgi:hypothetical protein